MKRLNLILYGENNSGKTTTLIELVKLLANNPKVSIAIVNTLSKKNGKGYEDEHFIIRFNNKLIYIATAGDSWSICKRNWDFFENQFKLNMNIYGVNSTGLHALNNKEKNAYKIGNKPVICICACRPDGDGYGAIKALHALSEQGLFNYSEQRWIHIDEKSQSKNKASELFNIINNF